MTQPIIIPTTTYNRQSIAERLAEVPVVPQGSVPEQAPPAPNLPGS